ncbi:MAG: ribosome silencing factor [Lachnospira sp.]|nr:ribosome silencing factor [Lachnospira sp.]
MNNSKEMLNIAVEAMKDKKAEDIRIIDISKVSVIADYFVIASGNNPNQVKAIVDNIEEKLFKAGCEDPKVEGYNSATWVLLDYKDVVFHVFSADDRRFYDLERIWRDGVEIDIENI